MVGAVGEGCALQVPSCRQRRQRCFCLARLDLVLLLSQGLSACGQSTTSTAAAAAVVAPCTTTTTTTSTTEEHSGLPWWGWFIWCICVILFCTLCAVPFIVAPIAEERREARLKAAAEEAEDDSELLEVDAESDAETAPMAVTPFGVAPIPTAVPWQ
mmetsp:Transcript_66328/g.158693  ORF Transcript_66328/g.158693 Transcript_66328/m.158693 type:complete len:157 (-) Transcript_66328:120-590(-)